MYSCILTSPLVIKQPFWDDSRRLTNSFGQNGLRATDLLLQNGSMGLRRMTVHRPLALPITNSTGKLSCCGPKLSTRPTTVNSLIFSYGPKAGLTSAGYWYWATDNIANLTFQSGADTDVRSAFTTSGVLANTNDTNFRAINDSYPTFAFAVDLGSVETTSVSTLFTLGLTQESAIQFDGASGNVSVPSLWTSYYTTELDAVSYAFEASQDHTEISDS